MRLRGGCKRCSSHGLLPSAVFLQTQTHYSTGNEGNLPLREEQSLFQHRHWHLDLATAKSTQCSARWALSQRQSRLLIPYLRASCQYQQGLTFTSESYLEAGLVEHSWRLAPGNPFKYPGLRLPEEREHKGASSEPGDKTSYCARVDEFQQSPPKADGEQKALGVKFWTEQNVRRETNM